MNTNKNDTLFSHSFAVICKKGGLSQIKLDKKLGTNAIIIDRCELGVIMTHIDVVEKITDALEVSTDYLIGKTKMILDQEIIERLTAISKLPEEKKSYLYDLIDMCLRGFKMRKSFAK